VQAIACGANRAVAVTAWCSFAKLRCMTALEQRCRETLERSWTVGERDGVSFAYTRPSPERYRWQWYWDSCFAAIAWRHFDPARSRAELETLLAAARPDGFIGHTIFWDHRLEGPRVLFYNVIHLDDPMTSTIEPPALAFAWRVAVGDPALEPRVVAHHRAVSAQRDLEGDGLLWILQPDESGLDASPQFDPIWHERAQGLPGFVDLVRRNREREFRIDAVQADGDPVVCEVMTNVLHGLSRLALGLPSITPALVAGLYDEQSGLFWPVAQPAPKERIPLTWTALAPLALPDLPEEIGRRLVEYLLDEQRFWTAVAPPAVSLDEPAFSLKEHFGDLRRYWRGPTWVNSAWLVWRGMVRLGYEQQAAALARTITDTVSREGLREFYDPHDGRGMGAQDFAWSALALELLDPDNASVGVPE
jgi:mannosylglycerate hydrolase MGH1-like protein